jgi:hypothetical protein
MTQPTKREQLAAMCLEDFKAHLRTIAGEDPKAEIIGATRPNPMLVRLPTCRLLTDTSLYGDRNRLHDAI